MGGEEVHVTFHHPTPLRKEMQRGLSVKNQRRVKKARRGACPDCGKMEEAKLTFTTTFLPSTVYHGSKGGKADTTNLYYTLSKVKGAVGGRERVLGRRI